MLCHIAQVMIALPSCAFLTRETKTLLFCVTKLRHQSYSALPLCSLQKSPSRCRRLTSYDQIVDNLILLPRIYHFKFYCFTGHDLMVLEFMIFLPFYITYQAISLNSTLLTKVWLYRPLNLFFLFRKV